MDDFFKQSEDIRNKVEDMRVNVGELRRIYEETLGNMDFKKKSVKEKK